MSGISLLPDEGQDEQQRRQMSSRITLLPEADAVGTAIARQAASVDPERFSKVTRVAEQLALPADVVERNFDRLNDDVKVRSMQERMLRDPVYARQMRDPTFAKLSQGDEDNLSFVQQALSVIGRSTGQILSGPATGVGAPLFDVSALAYDLASRGADITGIMPNVAASLAGYAEGSRERARRARGAVDYFFGANEGEGSTVRGVLSGAQSAGQMLAISPLMQARLFSGIQQASTFIAGTMAGGVGAEAYSEARDKGKSISASLTYAIPQGTFEYIFERNPVSVLLQGVASKTGLLPLALNLFKAEVIPEQFTTVVQDFNTWMNLNPEKTLMDFLKERPDAAYQTFVATLVGVGLQAGGARTAQFAVDRMQGAADKANNDAKGIAELLAAAANSQLRERHAPTFQSFMQAATQDGVDAVYANAQVFAQAAEAAGIDLESQMPETAALLQNALETRSDVRIPLSELATVAPGTTLEQTLVPELKTDPNGATQSEVADAAWVEETKRQTEKIFASQQVTDEWRQSAERVRSNIAEQLKAANRFTSDVNNAYAGFMSAFYATQANRLKLTPEEMYARYPIRVQAQEVKGPKVLSQYTPAQDAAREYARRSGLPYVPQKGLVTVDKARAARIAMEYEAMPHAPNDPEVKAAYSAMIDETLAQFQVIKESGLKIEFIKEGQEDPYAASPRMAIDDVMKNNHLWVFPTDSGFGSDDTDVSGNPLLAMTDEVVDGKQLRANDVFRIVHDYFGHIKDGNGFRAGGEENAWRSHSVMYSPLARRAMTTETRGQNSWVNFGPFGETNRTAKSADTVYAPQKTGLLPEWVTYEGAEDLGTLAEVPSFGRTTPHSVSVLAVHFSPVAGLTDLDSLRYGQGLKGAERERVMKHADKRMRQRVHFYVPLGQGVQNEAGTGENAYAVRLDNIYDLEADPLRLTGGDFETKVLEAGFDGYLRRDFDNKQGAVVLLGRKMVPVVPLGNLAQANAVLKDIAAPAPLKDDVRLLAEQFIKHPGLSGGAQKPAAWRAELEAKDPELLAKINPSVWEGDEFAYRDQIARRIDRSPSIFGQDEISSEWYYSELLRQVESLSMKQGTAKAWLDALKGLQSKGVKRAEIEATGIEEWLKVKGKTQHVGFWQLVDDRGAPLPEGLFTTESSALATAKNRGGTPKLIVERDEKITKQEVVSFLNKGGVQLTEIVRTEDDAVEIDIGSFKTAEPNEDYLSESAEDRLDDAVEEYARKNDMGVDDVPDDVRDSILDDLVEQEREWYYQDSESPQVAKAEVTVDGRTQIFAISDGYGELSIYHHGVGSVDVPRRSDRSDVEQILREYIAEQYGASAANAPEYGDYRTPGGEEYIELTLHLGARTKFNAPHFEVSENLLAHFRADVRTVEGKRTLYVDEIQSDWAQEGREDGFEDQYVVRVKKENGGFERYAVFNDEASAQAAAAALRETSTQPVAVEQGTIARAPFVTSTDAVTALVWKRIIRYAAENNLDRVVWTRGDQQVKRWSGLLRKQVDKIEWVKTEQGVHLLGYKGTGLTDGQQRILEDLRAREHPTGNDMRIMRDMEELVKGRKVVDTTYAESALSDAIGKAMGKRILEDPNQSGVIEGEQITIDSVGMAQAYGDAYGRKGDGTPSILTKVANEVLKKLGGGKVQGFAVDGVEIDSTFERWDGDTEVRRYSVTLDGTELFATESEEEADKFLTTVKTNPGFDVTPEVKAKALAGMPLFQGARGQISFAEDIKTTPSVITLLAKADLSTFLHETGHFYLEVLSDIAAQPDAPQEFKDDLSLVLNWFAVDSDKWRSMTLEEKRPYHEQWARGIEAYLFEGRAPSLDLQAIFGRFRTWLINVYQHITGGSTSSENFQRGLANAAKADVRLLNDEVRQVMDRLLATNEEIMRVEDLRRLEPLFDTKPEGMTDDEWTDYQTLGGDSTQAALDNLQTRSLRDMQFASNAKNSALKQLQRQAADKRRAVRAEVQAEVEQEPVYRAMAFLKRGILDGEQLEGGKLSIPAMKEMFGEGPAAPWRYLPTNMVSKEGLDNALHPEFVAELLGFTSGEVLVKELLAAENIRDKVDGITDQRMLERFGELSDPESMERAANAAVANEVRAKFVATELRMLDKAVGDRGILMSMAKGYASELVARLKIRSIRPSVYEAAQTKAARNAERAQLKGNIAEAAGEKRNQLVNLYASKASNDALLEIDKAVSYLKRVADSKTIDPEYTDQIRAMLERFDLRRVSERELAKRASLAAWLEAEREKGNEPAIDPALENEANRKPYQEMTLEEFRGLVDSVRNIEHLGRLKNKLLRMADQRAFKAVVDEATASIVSNAKRSIPEAVGTPTMLEAAGSIKRQVMAFHTKMSSFMRQFDGWRDNGVMQRLFVHSANEAAAREASMQEAATVKLVELFKPLKNLNKRVTVPGINAKLTRENLLMIALNTGNEGNLQRLMDGDRWSSMQVQNALDALTKEEMDFVQGVWDFVGEYRSMIGEQQKRLTGLEPKWIEPRKVVTRHGEYRGGYIPAKYDVTRSTRSLSDEASADVADMWRAKRGAATTRSSFVKGRAEKVINRPLRKDFGVITQHVTEVTHRLAWQEWLVDATRLLRAKPIDGAIREHYGAEVLESLRRDIENIATGPKAAQNVIERAVGHVRHGTTVVGLGWRFTTAMLQVSGLSQSMVRVGTPWIARGVAEFVGDAVHMENTVARIAEKSEMMRLRAKTMQREISEIRNIVQDKSSAIEASYFYMIQKMQMMVDTPTWLGAYHKAIATNGILDPVKQEANAIAQADQAVLDAQGGGQIKDLPEALRGGQWQKLWTNFASFFIGTTFQLTREAVGRTNFKSPVSMAFLAVDFLLLYSLPAAFGTMLKWALSDDDEDEDKLIRTLIADQLSYLTGTMLFLRELTAAARIATGLPGDYGGPAGARIMGELTKLGKEVKQGDIDEALLKAAANTAAILSPFHFPAGQINATLDGLLALIEGKTDNPGVLLVGSQQ